MVPYKYHSLPPENEQSGDSHTCKETLDIGGFVELIYAVMEVGENWATVDINYCH